LKRWSGNLAGTHSGQARRNAGARETSVVQLASASIVGWEARASIRSA
jgi:hypothetical protein